MESSKRPTGGRHSKDGQSSPSGLIQLEPVGHARDRRPNDRVDWRRLLVRMDAATPATAGE
jgi:hypothetical protein